VYHLRQVITPMKADRSIFTVLLLVTAAVFQLPAQQNEADRKVLAEIRAGAEKREAWTREIQSAKALAKREDSAPAGHSNGSRRNHHAAAR
jgi:hypothetical protein